MQKLSNRLYKFPNTFNTILRQFFDESTSYNCAFSKLRGLVENGVFKENISLHFWTNQISSLKKQPSQKALFE